jgi:2'-5' RNA ligase
MAPRGSRLRLFVAADFPEPIKRSVEKAIQPMRLMLPDAKWTAREQWHLTLKFLGHVDEDRLEEITKVAAKVAATAEPIDTRLTELGAFPNLNRARVVWVGIDNPDNRLTLLDDELERRYAKRGFKKESRLYHPHLTVARLRSPQPISEALEAAESKWLGGSSFSVPEIVLYRSHLSPKGARYEPLSRHPLAGPS